jgi:hypothetical protein
VSSVQRAQLFQQPLDPITVPVADDGNRNGVLRRIAGGTGAGTYNRMGQRTNSQDVKA